MAVRISDIYHRLPTIRVDAASALAGDFVAFLHRLLDPSQASDVLEGRELDGGLRALADPMETHTISRLPEVFAFDSAPQLPQSLRRPTPGLARRAPDGPAGCQTGGLAAGLEMAARDVTRPNDACPGVGETAAPRLNGETSPILSRHRPEPTAPTRHRSDRLPRTGARTARAGGVRTGAPGSASGTLATSAGHPETERFDG